MGRQSTATLRIPLPSVSRNHCELMLDNGEMRVRDLGSSNGTFKNFERIEESELVAGDVLGIGGLLITIQVDGKPEVIEAPEPPVPTEEALAETPPAGSPALPADDDDPDKTVTKTTGAGGLLSGLDRDDSSIFDFDFDFEDDEKPQL